MNHDVFISHAKEDRATAEEMYQWLEKEGIRCWMAPRDIRAAANYQEEIIEAIKTAKVMVVILSSAANDSPFVPKEVERAVTNRVSVLPFRVEDVPPGKSLELFISSAQWLDAITRPMEEHYARLAGSISQILPNYPDVHARSPLNHRLRSALPGVRKKFRTAGIIGATVIVTLGVLYVIETETRKKSDSTVTTNENPPPVSEVQPPSAPPSEQSLPSEEPTPPAEQEPPETSGQEPPIITPNPQPQLVPFAGGFYPTSFNGQPCIVFSGKNLLSGPLNGVTITAVNEISGEQRVFLMNAAIPGQQQIVLGPREGWIWLPGTKLIISAAGYMPAQWVFNP